MIEKILKLGKETAVYGLSTVMGRFLNFLLVPFYTNLLIPAEFGVIANVYAYIAFVVVVYGYGMEQAYMRFVSSLEIGDKQQNFSVPFFSLVGTSVVFSSLIYFCSSSVAALIDIPRDQTRIVEYAAWILCFDTIALVPFASFRMAHRAKMFASLKLTNIVLTLILNIVFLVSLRMKVEGVFLANLIASISTCLVTVWIVRSSLTLRWFAKLYKEILRFGLPLIPAGLAGIALQVVDRPILKALTDDATLGIYQANYRLGILMMLVVGMFDYAWRPFFLNHARDDDARQMFSKILTYLFVVLMGVFLVGSLFVEDIVRLRVAGRYFIHPDYWPGLSIVPWTLLAYVFTGIYTIFVPGVYLEKKTKYIPLNSGFGAALKVGLNYALIPSLGLMGAAQATLWSYVAMAIGMFFVSQKFYRIECEWTKIIRVAVAALALYGLSTFLSLEAGSLWGILTKAVLVACFVIVLLFIGIVSRKEMQQFRTVFVRNM